MRRYQDVPIDEMDDHTRAIVRQEIASLAGKAMRRTQDRNYTRSPDRNLAVDVANEELAQFWGEVLAEYSDEWVAPAEPIDVPPEASLK